LLRGEVLYEISVGLFKSFYISQLNIASRKTHNMRHIWLIRSEKSLYLSEVAPTDIQYLTNV